MSRLVLDTSVAVAWCFEDETTAYTERVLDSLVRGAEALVPPLWPYEVANALLVAERRGRVTWAKISQFLHALSGLPVSVDTQGVTAAFEQVLATARTQNLYVYDAAYLELALREALPLATLDSALRKAAKACGVKIAGGK